MVENGKTFLGYYSANGEEMHCGRDKCISPVMCRNGCTCPVAKSVPAQVATCPHCGSVLAEPVWFSPTKQRIYDFIRTHPQCTMADIMAAIYGHLPAPPSDNVVTVQLKHIRAVLAEKGLAIHASRPGPGATYTLTKESIDVTS